MDFMDGEDISGLKGYHYRRVFKGYDRKGNPKYNYKVIRDGQYVKNPLNKGEFNPKGANAISKSIPESVLNWKSVGDKKQIKIRTTAPGNQRGTKTSFVIWNGNDYVKPGDPTLVPDRAGGSPPGEKVVTDSDVLVTDNSSSSEDDTGNIYLGDGLKINWSENLGEGIYDSFDFGGPSEELKVAGRNSMPSTKWASTKEGDFYTYKGKRVRKGSVTARHSDRIMAAKEEAKRRARLRIKEKGE